MRQSQRRTLKFAALGTALVISLTACPQPVPPPPPASSVNLTFSLPPISNVEAHNLTLAAYYFVADTASGKPTGQIKVLQSEPLAYSNFNGGGTVTTASLSLYDLSSVSNDPTCLSAFVGRSTQNRTQVVVTPATVKTCDIYFSVYSGSSLNTSTEKYTTNDFLSYASSDFTYSFVSSDGNSTEFGNRKQGVSLVRHSVLQPSATPGKYLVSMNSVPNKDQAVPIRLHAPTNGLISQNLARAGGQK